MQSLRSHRVRRCAAALNRRSAPTAPLCYFVPDLSTLLSHALRRFAAFSRMIPRLAALSIAEISARICSALGVPEERTCFCIVRSRATTPRLRSDLFKVWRARLAADLVLAMTKSNFANVDARGAIAIVNLGKRADLNAVR